MWVKCDVSVPWESVLVCVQMSCGLRVTVRVGVLQVMVGDADGFGLVGNECVGFVECVVVSALEFWLGSYNCALGVCACGECEVFVCELCGVVFSRDTVGELDA